MREDPREYAGTQRDSGSGTYTHPRETRSSSSPYNSRRTDHQPTYIPPPGTQTSSSRHSRSGETRAHSDTWRSQKRSHCPTQTGHLGSNPSQGAPATVLHPDPRPTAPHTLHAHRDRQSHMPICHDRFRHNARYTQTEVGGRQVSRNTTTEGRSDIQAERSDN